MPWALCLGGLTTFGCQSQLLTLGTRPVENEAGSAGAAFGGTAPSGGAGAGGITAGQGGDAAGPVGGNGAAAVGGDAGGEAGAGAGAAGTGGAGTIRILDVSPIAELASEDDDDNPTLTADLLHIYFLSTRGESADVWTASRSTPTALFGEAESVAAVNTDEAESSPAISLDGLTLWVGQEREGGLGADDIWSVTRGSMGSAWSEPQNVTVLNSSDDDIPRQPGFQGLVMPLGSRRGLDGLFHTYLASRSSTSAAFEAPQLISELVFDERSTVDGFLTADGLMLFYASSTAENASDLYVVTRPGADMPFGEPVPLSEVNSPNDERDPWVSPDGKTLFFAAYNDGDRDLFTAQVTWE